MTEMKADAIHFAQLESTENLHGRVTRALALQVIKAERNSQQLVFPNEGELCRQLGVSRSILRESIKVLQDKGMVEVRPRSGTRALPRAHWDQLDGDILAWQSSLKPDPHFLLDFCEVRLAIEPVAAGFAALRATDEELATIRECLGRRLQLGAAEDLDAAIDANLQFHHAVTVASHNPLFLQLNTTGRDPFRIALSYTLRVPASLTLELDAYRRLTEAIEARHPLEAKRAAEEVVGLAMLAVDRVIRDHEDETKPPVKPQHQRKAGKPHIVRSRPEP
jgi:DNA-binding FadR family transcriptional regulator